MSRKSLAHPIVVLATALGTLLAARGLGLRMNLTASLPVGFYVARRAELVRGELVLICLPPEVAAFARARGYVARGGACALGTVPIGKRVLALGGDTVLVTGRGIVFRGVLLPDTRALDRDRAGRPLSGVVPGAYVIPPGYLWVTSARSPYGFDSRYFGPLPLELVQGGVEAW